jgi:hypothetical protein
VVTDPRNETIWRGRVHLGDAPGIFGDAQYAGICSEHPITIYRSPLEDFPLDEAFELIVRTDCVRVLAGLGHVVSAFVHDPDPQNPNQYKECLADEQRVVDQVEETVVIVRPDGRPQIHVTVRLRVDTTIRPGLYNDFLLLGLDLRAQRFHYYASYGFQ